MMRLLPFACLVLGVSCTPTQRTHVRTALEANQCVNALALRHLNAGDDFTDPTVLAVLASEIAVECTPQKASE